MYKENLMGNKPQGFCIFAITQQTFMNKKTCCLVMHKDMIYYTIYDGKDSELKKYGSFTYDLNEMCDFIRLHGGGHSGHRRVQASTSMPY